LKQTPQRAVTQLRDAVRKAIRPNGLSEDLRLRLGLNEILDFLNAYVDAPKVFDQVMKNKGEQKPKLSFAYEQEEAALAAARICQALGIPLITTRKRIKTASERTADGGEVVAIPTDEVSEASIYLRLAAILYGDESADMYHHCREARRREARRR
jgi:hypothetical protein